MGANQTNTRTIDVRELNMRDMIHALTGGRPHLFMIMAYNQAKEGLYERIRSVSEEKFNVVCIRADEVKSSGYDLLAKIHDLIARAELVIAEISEWSPNVFYEIGYAVGVRKPPLLLIEKAKEVPTDLKGLEVVEYKYDWDGIRTFEADLTEHLRFRMNSDFALLRDMLEAPVPEPAYLVTSPKYPGRHSRIQGQVYDTRTFGDHLGILGLISAFGSMRGEGKGIDLVSAQHSPPDLWKKPMSLYLIGSKKVNPTVGIMMERLQGGREPNWSIEPALGFTEKDQDWPGCLYRTAAGNTEAIQGELEETEVEGEKAEIWKEDYGIVLRGAHPLHPGRLVLILAGAHSLGTGAACLAATRSALIQKIRSRLPTGALEDKTCTFWVLVKGVASDRDCLLDEEGVSVEDAGVYQRS